MAIARGGGDRAPGKTFDRVQKLRNYKYLMRKT